MEGARHGTAIEKRGDNRTSEMEEDSMDAWMISVVIKHLGRTERDSGEGKMEHHVEAFIQKLIDRG